MEQIKICPVCGRENPVEKKFCITPGCPGNLMGVFPSASCSSENENCVIPEEETPQCRFVKVCPKCRKKNPAWVEKCKCGEEIDYIIPADLSAGESETAEIQEKPERVPSENKEEYFLRSEDGFCIIPIREGKEIIIGTVGDASEYLAGKARVSRKHLKLQFTGEWVIVTDISRNGTMINAIKAIPNEPMVVRDGDLLSLGVKEEQAPRMDVAYFRLLKKKKEGKIP